MTNAYQYIKQNLRNNLSEKMIGWRAQPSVTRIDKPTDIGKARMLGYKDKKGFVIVRVVLKRGGRKRPMRKHNRRSKRQTIRKNLMMNYREVAEIRAQKKYASLEVLNSYYLAKDGKSYFFEVILVDPEMPEIKSDRTINWICSSKNTKRALRGMTYSGKKARGLKSLNQQ